MLLGTKTTARPPEKEKEEKGEEEEEEGRVAGRREGGRSKWLSGGGSNLIYLRAPLSRAWPGLACRVLHVGR